MSHVPTRRLGARASHSRLTGRLIALAAASVALFGIAVPSASAADTSVTQVDLCRAWQAGTQAPQITLSSGLVVSADRLERVGASCTSPGAQINLTGAAVTTSTTAGPTGTAASQVLATVLRAAGAQPDLKEGDELFKGAVLKNFNAVLKLGYFEISGAIEIQFSGGTTSRFLFKGKLYGIDRFTMSLYSPVGGTSLPNIGGAPVTYSGTLVLNGKQYTLDLTGSAPSIEIGQGAQQLTVSGAQLALSLADTNAGQRLQLDVTGLIGLGSSVSAQGTLHADFDGAGLSALVGGGALAVTIPAKGTSAAGSIAGSAAITYTREPSAFAVTFTGDVQLGDALVAGASGTLDAQSANFTGNLAATGPGLTAKGAVDGVVYYGPDLAGRTITARSGQQVPAAKGDALLKTASGELTAKGISVGGAVTFGNVGSDVWAKGGGSIDFTNGGTQVKGSADIDWVKGQTPAVSFSGSIISGTTTVASASGTFDGRKLLFQGQVSSPTVSGAATGGVYYGSSLAGETVVNRAGATVPATSGDLYLTVTDGRVQLKQLSATASFTLKKVGAETWLKTDAQIKVAQTWLTFSGELDNAGNVNLKGAGAVNFDGTVVSFSGTATVQNGALVLAGSGTLQTGLFAATVSGTIQKPDMATSQYVLTGSANFKFANFPIAGATVRLTFGEGLTTTFGIKACFLFFICPNATYKLYFAGGNVSRAELNAPVAWAVQFLAIGSIALGPKVPISTKITGLI